MDEYERVYSPGVTSTLWDLDDDIILTDTYVHNFTLHYIDVLFSAGPHTTASFTFGKFKNNILHHQTLLHFLQ